MDGIGVPGLGDAHQTSVGADIQRNLVSHRVRRALIIASPAMAAGSGHGTRLPPGEVSLAEPGRGYGRGLVALLGDGGRPSEGERHARATVDPEEPVRFGTALERFDEGAKVELATIDRQFQRSERSGRTRSRRALRNHSS